jgi:hypothetical protein
MRYIIPKIESQWQGINFLHNLYFIMISGIIGWAKTMPKNQTMLKGGKYEPKP